MNIDLPDVTTVGDVVDLLARGIANGAAHVLTTWWGITATLLLLVCSVCAYVGDMGFTDYDDTSPFLTEEERAS